MACLCPANALLTAACCTDDNLSHLLAVSSKTSSKSWNSLVELRSCMLFKTVSTSDRVAVVPSSSINSRLPALISDILLKIVLNELPITDIDSCEASPTAASYPNNLFNEIPAKSALAATRLVASARPPASTAAAKSIDVKESFISATSSTDFLYPFIIAVR